MQGTAEIDAMRAAGPPRTYHSGDLPLRTLIDRLGETSRVRYVQVARRGTSMELRTRQEATS